MSPKTGRPKSDNPKSESFHIRVTASEKEEIMRFSKDHDMSLLDLIRAGIESVKEKR